MSADVLTPDLAKRGLIESDSYFRESLDRLRSHTGDPAAFLWRHSVLLLKPDAVATRALLPAIDWLSGQGLQIVAAGPTRLSRHMVRALWPVQWRLASPYRRWLADLFAPATDSLVLVVRVGADVGSSAAAWLTELKGPADPAARRPGQLRHLLGRYSFLLNLVHTPDGPVDVARELAVLFDDHRLGEVYENALDGRDRTGAARELARTLHTQTRLRDLSLEPAAERLQIGVGRLLADPALAPTVRAELRSARPPETGPAGSARSEYQRLMRLLWRYRLVPDVWDVVTVGSYVLPMREPQIDRADVGRVA